MNFISASDSATIDFILTSLVPGTINVITSDKDWMPYRHFEYEPLWHKKYAAIKYQMEKMWD